MGARKLLGRGVGNTGHVGREEAAADFGVPATYPVEGAVAGLVDFGRSGSLGSVGSRIGREEEEKGDSQLEETWRPGFNVVPSSPLFPVASGGGCVLMRKASPLSLMGISAHVSWRAIVVFLLICTRLPAICHTHTVPRPRRAFGWLGVNAEEHQEGGHIGPQSSKGIAFSHS